MNLQSLVVVILRLITLNFLLDVAVMSARNTILLLNDFTSLYSYLLVFLLASCGLFVCAILLWIFALPIARLVTRGISQDISFGAMPLADWYSIAFIGIGLYYIADYLASVLKLTFHLFKGAASSSGTWWVREVDGAAIAQAFIPFIAGILLFIYGRKWAAMLARKHTNIPSPVAADNEKHVSEN